MKNNLIFLLSIVFTSHAFSQTLRQFEIDANVPEQEIYSGHLKLGGSNPKGEKIAVNNYYITINNKPFIPVTGEFKVRGEATSVAVLSLWAAYFILVFTFPVMIEKMQDKSFYIYSAVCALGFLFVWEKVRETKGNTLEELENVMTTH